MTPIFLPEADPAAGMGEGARPQPDDPEDSVEQDLLEDALEEAIQPDPAELPVPPEPESSSSQEPLLDLDAALSRIPESLRKDMENYLRAEFREVVRWKMQP